jgi:HD-like signal output (HDOD) protein
VSYLTPWADKMSDKNQNAALLQSAVASHEQTMARIREGLERLGDLPIFSTSINKVRRISTDPNSDAMAVAKEVLKDANLSAKLLRLSNSAFYNRGVGKIAVISRAVIILGFETVRNLTLTLKLIESFQNGNSNVDMSKMLVKSYLAAGFVRDIAEKCGVKDIEESYVCALLHNLGEITVAYVLPDEYQRIAHMIDKGTNPTAAENAVLGTSISLISQDLAASWEFPATVVNTMAPPPTNITGIAKDRVSFNHSVASMAYQLLDNLYTDSNNGGQLANILEMLSKATGLNDAMMENYLNESFRMSCTLATEYGLDKKLLKPTLGNAEGTLRNKWARQFSYYASMDEGAPAASPDQQVAATAIKAHSPLSSGDAPLTHAVTPVRKLPSENPVAQKNIGISSQQSAVSAEAAPPPSTSADTAPAFLNHRLQLQIIQEITDLIAKSARLSEVFVKVLDGLHRGAGFERVLLCLVTPDRRNYVGRLAAGAQSDILKQYFFFPIQPSSDLFSKTLMEGGELTVSDTSDSTWRNLLTADFVEVTKASSFAIAALRYQEKAVGFFYADCAVSGRAIHEADQRNLLQFVTQARLALRLCS